MRIFKIDWYKKVKPPREPVLMHTEVRVAGEPGDPIDIIAKKAMGVFVMSTKGGLRKNEVVKMQELHEKTGQPIGQPITPYGDVATVPTAPAYTPMTGGKW